MTVARECLIVEGEPGIFPAPIAGALVRLNRWLRRRLGRSPAASAPSETDGSGEATAGPPERPDEESR